MATTPKPMRKKEKMGSSQIRRTSKDLEEGRSIQPPGKSHKVEHKLRQKAYAHMKKHGG